MIWYVLGFLAHSSTAADRRHGLCCKRLHGQQSQSDCCLSKGVLLALELLGYDSSN